MSHPLDTVLNDFNSDVTRVENLLKLTKLFRDFGASEPPSPKVNLLETSPLSDGDQALQVVDSQEHWQEALDLHADSKARRTDLPILSGSLLLYLSGRFEYCVRQIVESIADDIAGRTTKFQNLPTQIQRSLKFKTLEIALNPKKKIRPR